MDHHSSADIVFDVILPILFTAVLYLLPSEIAFLRGHARRWQILVGNILLGWTFLIWCYCLIVAIAPGAPMTDAIAYLRASARDPEASRDALGAQQAAVEAWTIAKSGVVIAEFIEIEADGPDRPQLVAALSMCRQARCPLIIASTAAIGHGAPFHPRIASVPVIVLLESWTRPRQTMPCPARCQKDVCLFVGPTQQGYLPLYLCNPKSSALLKIEVQGGGLQIDAEALHPTTTSRRTFERIDAQTCQLLEERNIFSEGDFLDCLRVAFEENGERRVGSAFIRDVIDRHRPIPLQFR